MDRHRADHGRVFPIRERVISWLRLLPCGSTPRHILGIHGFLTADYGIVCPIGAAAAHLDPEDLAGWGRGCHLWLSIIGAHEPRKGKTGNLKKSAIKRYALAGFSPPGVGAI